MLDDALTAVEAIRLRQLIITISAWLEKDCPEQAELQTEAAFLLRGLSRFYPIIELTEEANDE